MTTFTPTPGPWQYEGPSSVGGPHVFATVKGRRWVVASCTSSRIWIGPPKEYENVEPESVANAHLIASAPDLYLALREMVEYYGADHEQECPGDDTCNCKLKPFNDRVNNALARAEGRDTKE